MYHVLNSNNLCVLVQKNNPEHFSFFQNILEGSSTFKTTCDSSELALRPRLTKMTVTVALVVAVAVLHLTADLHTL